MAAQNAARGARRARRRDQRAAQGDAPPAGAGLNGIRPDLEHHPQPRDPFKVDVQAALEALSAEWGQIYLIAYVNGWWRARLLDGTGDVLAGLSPDDLAVKMRAGWNVR